MRIRTRLPLALRAFVTLGAVVMLATSCGSSLNVAEAAKTAVQNGLQAECDAVSDYDCQNAIVVANCKSVTDASKRKRPAASKEWTCDVTNDITGNTITAMHLYRIDGSHPTQLGLAGIDPATLRNDLMRQ